MRKIINVILAIALIVSVGFNIFLIIEKNKVTDQISNQEEQITSLNSEIERVKSDSDSKDSDIENLKSEVIEKDEEIKGITESLENLESEKEQLSKELEDKSSTVVEQGKSQTGGEISSNTYIVNQESGVSAEEFTNIWGIPVYEGEIGNPNSTGGSNGAINWGQ